MAGKPRPKPTPPRSRAPLQPARPSPKKKRARAPARARRGSAARVQAGSWHDWKTPDEAWKLRAALALLLGCLLALACWTGEVRYSEGHWRAGLRGLRGETVVGLEWTWGEWPRRWSPR